MSTLVTYALPKIFLNFLLFRIILGVTLLLHLISYVLKDLMEIFPSTKQINFPFSEPAPRVHTSYSKPANQFTHSTIDSCMEIHRPTVSEKFVLAFSVEENFKSIFNNNIQREVFPIIGGLK